jgi:GTPase SAR1 family protein
MSDKKEEEVNRIRVYLRIRPAKKNEINEAEGQSYLMNLQPDNKTVLLEGGKNYNFDYVFDGPNVKQEDMFQMIAVPVVNNVFKGFWGSMMVYGQTGTGKSFTMCNFDKGAEGIIPRVMLYMFEQIAADPDRLYTISFSFIQIYLDKLQDLFNPTATTELKLTRDKDGVAFPGILERTCENYEHFKELYDSGNQHRVITATKMNPESSRGHAALFMQVKSVPRDDPSGENRNGKLYMIDLAGYERFSKTGCTEGIMKEEAKTINGSLLSLGNCVQSLSEKSEHIPWRNAKLTRMLEDAIGGKAKCSIILTAGPSNEHMHETVGTLYFGSRAMSIKTSAKLAVNIDYQKLAKKLQDMLNAAEGKISALEVAATERQMEREENAAGMQSEKASMLSRQETQMQALLMEGASAEKVQQLIRANATENEILDEQHYTMQSALDEKHEFEMEEGMKKQNELNAQQSEKSRQGLSSDMAQLQRDVLHEREEKESYKGKAKEAEAEARRLFIELNDQKMEYTASGADFDDPMSSSPRAGKAGSSASEMRAELTKRVAAVKEMLEQTHEMKLQEVEEPLREEVARFQKLYEDLRASADDDLLTQKDALTTMYEQEIEDVRKVSTAVQDKLKKNHTTIKLSYQRQKEEMVDENEDLMRQVGALQAGGASASNPMSPRPGVPSLAEVMIMKKKTEGRVKDLEAEILQYKSDLDYVQTEKSQMEGQLTALDAKPGEERLNPAAVRKLRDDFAKLTAEKADVETELFKAKAAQALSGPTQLTNQGGDDDDDAADEMDAKEDMAGDFEGMSVFAAKLLKFPYFSGAQKVNNAHDHVLASLTTDLDEYRRSMKMKIMMLGPVGSGKTSIIKCLTAGSVPMMKSAPEVHTTLQPNIQSGTVEDSATSKAMLHKLYVKFEAPPEDEQKSQSALGGIAGSMFSKIGLGSTGVSDPAKIHIDLIDLPGAGGFWRGVPSQLLPGKNVCYVVAYNISQPLDAIREDVAEQLRVIHASASRNYPRVQGGDAPRVAVCLLGTHRDAMRESKEAQVLAFLNKVTVSLGEVFFKLRGDDTYGLVLVGNFAVSCREWTVTSTKGNKAPQSFKELFTFLATCPNQLYDTRPSALIASSKAAASHSTYVLGEETHEGPVERTAALHESEKRLRRGVVTLLSVLQREQKVRWVMNDVELRALVSEHLGVDDKSAPAIGAVNFVIRELMVRGIIAVLPSHVYEAKYLPKPNEQYDPDAAVLGRDAIVVLDPLRVLMIYSGFIAPTAFAKLMVGRDHPVFTDRATALFDLTALAKTDKAWMSGIVTQQLVQLTCARFLPLTCSDAKMMLEVLCVLGLGIGLKQEVAMISPVHFSVRMPVPMADYLSYLLSCHGDGVGRKYTLNTVPAAFFARLQTLLIPFSHAPVRDAAHNQFNWVDASFLVLEKPRLKFGIFGSKTLKDAVMAAALPVRGIMKLEGQQLYVAVTARGPSPAAMTAAVKPILAAIHHTILVLCKREFRGVTASFQEMTIAGVVAKRQKLPTGVRAILENAGASQQHISQQIQTLNGMADPRAQELEQALQALPDYFKADQ